MKTGKEALIAMGLAVVLILFPFFAPKFQLRMVTEIIILTLFAMTWKMMLNEGGMFSFGHAVYFGLGAYASVLGWLHIPGLSFFSGILLGALTSALVAFILGAFLVRMSGTYFALLTLPVEARPNTFPAYVELQVTASISGEGLLSLAREWPENFQETRLRTKDGYFVEPWVIMLQAINHATEHREQVKSMLSSLGVTPPEIDGWSYGEAVNALIPISTG